MTQKVAVAVVHGVGKQSPHFADNLIEKLRAEFAERVGKKAADPERELVVRTVYWAPEFQNIEKVLWNRLKRGGELDFITLRHFMVDFAGDAIAYQPTPLDRRMYEAIHRVFAQTLAELAQEAGGKAPLGIVAHSLGTVITSNYFYDLQTQFRRDIVSESVRAVMGDAPLERGETLTLLYTLGSPLAIWSMRYRDFGVPIQVPAPQLGQHYPNLRGEWVNFYDRDDVFGFPLKTLNKAYRKAVKADREINVGGFLSSWSPGAHMGYWDDPDVIVPIAQALARTWRKINR